MEFVRKYGLLHFGVLLFSFTSVFAKMAANAYNAGGITDLKFLILCAVMILNCMVYAIFWQIVIKDIDLHIAYANRSVYLIWSQIWAVWFFAEHLTLKNIIGLAIVLTGVIIVTMNVDYDDDKKAIDGGDGEEAGV